jgi:cytochrome P450
MVRPAPHYRGSTLPVMRTPLHPHLLAELPVDEIATSAAPDRWHGPLQSLGTHRRDEAFVVSGHREVAAALASPALSVAPARGQAAGFAAELVARMARFSDGEDHRRRREIVSRLLPPVARVSSITADRVNDYLLRRTSAFDVMPLARQLPAEVLALGLGLPAAEADRAAFLTGVLCDALTPALRPRKLPPGAADAAAEELEALFGRHLPAGHPERLAAAISILFQARDATAALIGTAVLAGSGERRGPHSAGQRVEQVLRHDAPVQCTRRTAMADAAIGDVTVPAGAAVWIFLATAEQGSGMPATFGSGPHGCPGAAHATAIARQVVTVIDAEGWRPVAAHRVEYEPRPNIRVPVRVLVARS